MRAYPHGRKLESIAEQPALFEGVSRFGQFVGAGARPVEEQPKAVRPDLGVAGHRLAIETYVMRVGAKEHMGQFVLLSADGQFILMAMDFAPAVRAYISVSDRAVPRLFLLARPRLVKPP